MMVCKTLVDIWINCVNYVMYTYSDTYTITHRMGDLYGSRSLGGAGAAYIRYTAYYIYAGHVP
jgi:hypothetical protein